MLLDHATKLRQYIKESSDWPLDLSHWPDRSSFKTNCLAFALGLCVDLGSKYLDYGCITSNNPILHFPTIFEEILTQLDLDWRKLSSSNEAQKDEYVLQIYGFYPHESYPFYDFHVIRRDLDGTWVHKPCYLDDPEKITEWKTFDLVYSKNSLSGIYAVKKKTP